MGEMRRTTEALHNAEPGEEGVMRDASSGLYLAKGPEFNEAFMAHFALPFRRQCAQMILQQHMAREGELRVDEMSRETKEKLAESCWEMSDALVLSERSSLEGRMGEYWDLYMRSSKGTDDVMGEFVDGYQDYSA